MTPRIYYEDESVRLYHGDCLDVLPTLGTGFALVTDPPYGIKEARGKNATRGKTTRISGRKALAESTDWGVSDWDDKTADEAIALARSISQWQVIFGGNYYALPPTSCWLVWDKDNGETDFSDCELAWTNFRKAVRKLTFRWNGMLQQPGRQKEPRVHPTQKPEPVMVWAVSHVPNASLTVLDPFAGSGTTLVAAKRLGRRAIGIEREERFCAVAARRLSQGALNLEFSA